MLLLIAGEWPNHGEYIVLKTVVELQNVLHKIVKSVSDSGVITSCHQSCKSTVIYDIIRWPTKNERKRNALRLDGWCSSFSFLKPLDRRYQFIIETLLSTNGQTNNKDLYIIYVFTAQYHKHEHNLCYIRGLEII